jgi:hypothetical protein
MLGNASESLNFVLGFGGSSSRTERRTSSSPFFSNSFFENGGEPVAVLGTWKKEGESVNMWRFCRYENSLAFKTVQESLALEP